MTKDKSVLIFAQTSHLAHVGGPMGYLNNLRNQLKKHNITKVHFIEDGEYKAPKPKKLKKIRDILYPFKRAYLLHKMLVHGKRSEVIENCQDDYIHFHYTEDLYKYRSSLTKYKGKIILTSHSPVIASKEIINSLSKFEKTFFKGLYSQLIEMDIFAFEHADYIIFPCEDAEEPYLHSWEGFKEFKNKNKSKFKYLLTGIDQTKARSSSQFIRRKYMVPQNAFLISYVGRHNEIKGYDNLKKIGQALVNRNKKNYFLIAGKEEPLKGISSKNWIEVGWTNDPYSLMNASDVFVLPNRETYFDLIFLEVLSLGKTIVATRTGGNKYFERFENSGIYLYDTNEECEAILDKLSKRSREKVKHDEEANLRIYKEYFTSEKFMQNYVKLIESL